MRCDPCQINDDEDDEEESTNFQVLEALAWLGLTNAWCHRSRR